MALSMCVACISVSILSVLWSARRFSRLIFLLAKTQTHSESAVAGLDTHSCEVDEESPD